jgi:hypothetical protein
MVRGCSGLLLNVNGELKGDVIVGIHSYETRDRRVDSFKIHEVARIFQGFKFALQFRAKPRLTSLHGVTDMPLKLA